jgi:hypothetical protein
MMGGEGGSQRQDGGRERLKHLGVHFAGGKGSDKNKIFWESFNGLQ